MKLPLCYYGDSILRKRGIAVEEITKEIRELVECMKETLLEENGVGLAAPQVGVSLRIFIVAVPMENEDGDSIPGIPEAYINPKLFSPSEELCEFQEGCLSVPNVYEYVTRPEKISVTAMNLDGEMFTRDLTGFEARIVMHENDHINGKLFVDRIVGKERKALNNVLNEIKKTYHNKSLQKS